MGSPWQNFIEQIKCLAKGGAPLTFATCGEVASYFFDQEQRPPSPEAQDTETAGRLWEDQRAPVRGLGAKRRSPLMTRVAEQACETCSKSGPQDLLDNFCNNICQKATYAVQQIVA